MHLGVPVTATLATITIPQAANQKTHFADIEIGSLKFVYEDGGESLAPHSRQFSASSPLVRQQLGQIFIHLLCWLQIP